MYFDTPIKALMLQILIVFIELIVTINHFNTMYLNY